MIYIDFETRSKVDLKKVGAWVYSQHPSTEVLCMAFTLDTKEVRLWKPSEHRPEVIAGFARLLADQLIEAHNAFFERAIWENIMVPKYGFPNIAPDKWRCSAAVAAYHTIPRALDKAGKALDLSVIKDQSGKRVMMQLAKPKAKSGEYIALEGNEEKYEKLYEYCKQDVEAERAIGLALGELPDYELKIWQLDQKINHRGVPIDREAAEAALKMLTKTVKELEAEAIELGEGNFRSLKQVAKIQAWCHSYDEQICDLTKGEVAEWLKREYVHPKVRRVLELRQMVGKTSTAKYDRMLKSLPADNRIRDTLMYHGAATGRWAGKGAQFHNLPRGSVKIKDMESAVELIKLGNPEAIDLCYGNLMQFMSTAIRGMVKASDGNMLVVADFASIEARVLAWLSGCELMLQQFRDGVDLYKDMAAKIYKVDVENVTDEQRQLGKAAILGAGYGMGPAKFLDTCLSWGMKIDEDLARLAIYTYRDTYPEVKNFWSEMERHSQRAVKYSANSIFWVTADKWLEWESVSDFLKCKLPSGRSLHYYKPEIVEKDSPYGPKPALTFMGEKQGKTGGKAWMRVDTYGGKLVENITQAVARDLMAEAMLRIEAAGFEIILSIHDEIVAEYMPKFKVTAVGKPDWYLTNPPHRILPRFEQLMSEAPSWAAGCPIEAKGWIGKHYKK